MLRAISLFTGIGGLDFGFEAAGFTTVAAVEMDPVACRAASMNRSWPLLEGDLGDISSRKILSVAGLKKGEADVLFGGPPCQPFSKSGYWATGDVARLADPRADTLAQFLRVLRDTRPRAFLLENVKGLAYRKKDEGLNLLLSGIETVNRQAKTNYRASWQVLNAADYGVPQQRERVFLVGSRDGKSFEFPRPTFSKHPDTELFPGELQPYRTAWDAIGDLDDRYSTKTDTDLKVRGKWGDLLGSIPEGQNYLHHTHRGQGLPLFGWRTRYWGFLLKLAKNLPAWTIQAQPGPAIGPFHWRSRRLSTEEICRLQTLPNSLRLPSSPTEVQRLLGNAVPGLLAEVLARQVRGQLLGAKIRKRELEFLPARRNDCPPPTRRSPVPKKYFDLIGNYPDHPGTGKGPGRIPTAPST